jgi:endonuclease/exonuclease/phosphatase family metal-dependent hydrolase
MSPHPTTRPAVEPLEHRCLPTSSSPLAAHGQGTAMAAHGEVEVMTQNLYLGADLTPIVSAAMSGDPLQIVNATTQTWAKVVASNFPERAAALAREVADTQPALIGLQEAALWQTGPADGPLTAASDTAYDFTQILLGQLAAQGLHYAAVVTENEFAAELPGFTAPGVLQDIRLTDRDVILARTDLPAPLFHLANAQGGHFQATAVFPLPGNQLLPSQRGWASVDVTLHGEAFRFVTTHLEDPSNAFFAQVQLAQAGELLAGPLQTSLPVILVGDFNADADGVGPHAAYDALIGAGLQDAWGQLHPADPGYTWGQAEDLRNPTSQANQRLDLVLSRGDVRTLDAAVVGNDPVADRTPSGLWPSDHFGVVAAMQIHPRPKQPKSDGLTWLAPANRPLDPSLDGGLLTELTCGIRHGGPCLAR